MFFSHDTKEIAKLRIYLS